MQLLSDPGIAHLSKSTRVGAPGPHHGSRNVRTGQVIEGEESFLILLTAVQVIVRSSVTVGSPTTGGCRLPTRPSGSFPHMGE